MIKRINLYGGPNKGKTAGAHWLVHYLKSVGQNIELCQEPVKKWAYEGRIPNKWDQVYLFSEELHNEELYLRHGASVVTDSPLLLNCYYSSLLDNSMVEEQLKLAQKFEEAYPSINIFLDTNYKYNTQGRYQTEDEAQRIHYEILTFTLKHTKNLYKVVDCKDIPKILRLV